MSLPRESETIYSDSEKSSDESIHESDIDFIDDSDVGSDNSDVDSESSNESGDDFQDNKCTIFKCAVINR